MILTKDECLLLLRVTDLALSHPEQLFRGKSVERREKELGMMADISRKVQVVYREVRE